MGNIGIGNTVTLAKEELDVDSEDRWDPVGGEAKKYKKLIDERTKIQPKGKQPKHKKTTIRAVMYADKLRVKKSL